MSKVLIVLLLFGVQLLTGQTVSKLEFENGTEVYQIIELQNNTVEFVNPLKRQPTLREIIFYKVVERPYIEKNEELEVVTKQKAKPRKPDFDETIRPFTNGHGLQFQNWGSQDENTEHRNAPEKEKNVNQNSNSTSTNSSDSKENHENDDKINDNKDNDNNDNYKLNNGDDDEKNNYKKSEIDKDEEDDDDDDDDKSNVKKPYAHKYDDDDEDDKDANKKHINDDSKIEDDDSSKEGDNSSGAKKAVDSTKGDDKKITEDKVKDEEVNKKEDEKARDHKVYEEEINLAKKLRSELLNSTKEKYHTIVRSNVNATHERKKREVSYQEIPEAPKLADLDVHAFPSYVQRMLANRPTFTNTQDGVRSNYNADLFHKMDRIFSNNKPKTYGFKYSNDKSESWNDIHKTQENQENVIAPSFKDLSGSQTNDRYEKISKPDIEVRNNFMSDEEQTTNKKETFTKNKDEIAGRPKNIHSTTSVINNYVYKDQESVEINNEKPNTDDLDKFSGIDIKDKLITMLQNIDNKFTKGKPPKTYGMSIKGAKVQTWNDISATPTVTKYENANKESIVENKTNKEENLNNEKNRLKFDFKEDPDNYENAHKENIEITKPHEPNKKSYAEEDNINTSYDNIVTHLGKYSQKPVTDIDDILNENTPENELENKSNTMKKENMNTSENYINLLNYNKRTILNKNKTENKSNKSEEKVVAVSASSSDDPDNYNEGLDQTPESTNKVVNNILDTPTEGPFDAAPSDEINEPKGIYNEFKNIQYVLSTTERLPEVTKENLLFDNEGFKLKMEESFDNIIKQIPKLNEIDLTESKAAVNFNKFGYNNKKSVKPNTYGMHLEGDNGYIWNDLTDPGKVTYVGNMNKINISKPDINHEATTTKIVENKVENLTELLKRPIVTTTEQPNTVEDESKGVTEKPIEKELNDKNSCNCNKDNVNEIKVDGGNKNETETLKNSLDELLKKDEFWEWLSNWTSTYMEVLNERVETLVKNEVANQLKQTNENKNNTKVNDCNKVNEGNKTNNTIDDNVDKQSDGNKDNTTENSEINEIHTNNNTTSDNNAEVKSNTAALEPKINNNITDATRETNNSGAISKENELNEVNNKTDPDMNKGKNNSLPVNIKSGTIYGNAIGNDHVTNIFIFYPSVDSNKTTEKIEPINKTNSDISTLEEKPANITIDERFGVAGEDKGNNVDDTVNKTKDLINSQNNTSSTVSSQQTKTDATEISKNSSKDTTTSKIEEELEIKRNGTDTESINNQKSNNTTKELNETSDATDSNTKKVDKTETTTGMSINNDDETTPTSTDKATISKTEKSDSTTEKSESESNKSDSTTEKTEKSDSTTEKPESASENSDSTTEKSVSKGTSDVTSTEKSAES